MNYILYAFASDFVPAVIHPGPAQYDVWRLLAYVPFAGMSVAAPLLVLAAAAHRRLEMRYSHARLVRRRLSQLTKGRGTESISAAAA